MAAMSRCYKDTTMSNFFEQETQFEGRKMVDARDERRSGDDVPGGEDGGDNEQVL